MHEDEAKGMTTVTRGDVGMKKGKHGGGTGAGELLYPIRHLYTGNRGQGWMHSKVGTSVRMDRDIYA